MEVVCRTRKAITHATRVIVLIKQKPYIIQEICIFPLIIIPQVKRKKQNEQRNGIATVEKSASIRCCFIGSSVLHFYSQ